MCTWPAESRIADTCTQSSVFEIDTFTGVVLLQHDHRLERHHRQRVVSRTPAHSHQCSKFTQSSVFEIDTFTGVVLLQHDHRLAWHRRQRVVSRTPAHSHQRSKFTQSPVFEIHIISIVVRVRDIHQLARRWQRRSKVHNRIKNERFFPDNTEVLTTRTTTTKIVVIEYWCNSAHANINNY